MINELVIRKVGAEDLTTIIKLVESVWPATYKHILSADQIRYMMELFYSEASLKEQFRKHSFIVAYLREKPVGFASCSPYTKDVYKLHKLYVDTAIQGRGLGKALIDFIITEVQFAGGNTLELNVNRDNKAKIFYEKMGFDVIRQEDIDIGNGFWMNDYVMQRFL